MVSHDGFRILGNVYGILGTLGALGDILKSLFSVGGAGETETVQYVSLPGGLLTMIFFIIFLVGMWTDKPKLVNIHRVFLVVVNVIAIALIYIALLFFSIYAILATDTYDGVAVMIIGLLICLGVVIGFFYLFLWIVNGVMAAIQAKQTANGTVVNYQPPNEQNKPPMSNPNHAPV